MKTTLRTAACWLALSVLAGCTGMTRLAYDNADVMVRTAAHDYFDLDTAQMTELQTRFERLQQWHRTNELPLYAAFLRDTNQRFTKGLAKDDVTWGFSTMRAHYRDLAARAAEEAAPVLATLEPEQIAVLEKKFADNDAKYTKNFLQADEKKRVRAQTRRMLDSLRHWTGNMTREQEQRVEEFVRAHQRHAALRFEDRQRWQREALALLHQRLPAKELAPRLAQLFREPESRRSEEFRLQDRRWQDDFAQLMVDLSGTLSRTQRAQVAERLEGYARDCAALAARPAKAAQS